MNFENLEKHFRKLASVEETSSPVISCYINNEDLRKTYREDLDLRIKEIRQVLPYNQRALFEETLGKVESYLSSKIKKDSQGIAVFARLGKYPFFEALQFKMPFETSLTVDTIPHLYQLVLMKDTYHRYVVLITEESHARIIEVSVGNITRELWTEKPELRDSAGRGWTKQHYQNHKRDRENKFIKEKVKVLDQLFTEGKHTHLVIAGNRQNVARVKDKLPKRLLEKLIDRIPIGDDSSTDDVVNASLSVYADFEQNESLNTAGLLLNEIQKGGLAVPGIRPSLRALQKGQVDVLVMSENFESKEGWKCADCLHVETGPKAKVCTLCGSKAISESDLKEEMIRIAEQMSTNIEILRDSDELYDLEGIGCLLRY